MTELDLPEGAVITAQLHFVEYIDPEDGKLYTKDFSQSASGGELTLTQVRDMAADAVLEYEAPHIAERVGRYLFGCSGCEECEEEFDDEDGDDDEVQPVQA